MTCAHLSSHSNQRGGLIRRQLNVHHCRHIWGTQLLRTRFTSPCSIHHSKQKSDMLNWSWFQGYVEWGREARAHTHTPSHTHTDLHWALLSSAGSWCTQPRRLLEYPRAALCLVEFPPARMRSRLRWKPPACRYTIMRSQCMSACARHAHFIAERERERNANIYHKQTHNVVSDACIPHVSPSYCSCVPAVHIPLRQQQQQQCSANRNLPLWAPRWTSGPPPAAVAHPPLAAWCRTSERVHLDSHSQCGESPAEENRRE